MQPIEIIVIILAVSLVSFTIIYNIIRRKQGKSSCGGDCSKCSSCPNREESKEQ